MSDRKTCNDCGANVSKSQYYALHYRKFCQKRNGAKQKTLVTKNEVISSVSYPVAGVNESNLPDLQEELFCPSVEQLSPSTAEVIDMGICQYYILYINVLNSLIQVFGLAAITNMLCSRHLVL